MQKITPFLWFDSQAEEAVNFYVSLFKNSKILNVSRYGEAGPGPRGSVMAIDFLLEGQRFTALNAYGGPPFKFTEAISFLVNCDTQEEVDELWERFCKDGKEGQCGWLKDKYGVSWQIIPRALGEMLSDADAEKAQRVMRAMIPMKKIEIEGLRRAYRNQPSQIVEA